MEKILKVGATVNWRGGWGFSDPKKARVKAIEVNCRDKDGTQVVEVPWLNVSGRSVIVSLDNGHWAYGNQISPIKKD